VRFRPALLASAFALAACAPGVTAHPSAATPSPAAPTATPPPPQAATADPRHVTVLILDMSRSMRSNDPDDVRCAAARTFIALGQPGELVGVIGFSDSHARVWAPPMETTPDNQRTLEQAVADNCRTGVYTPTYRALDEAYRQLDGAPGSGPRSAMLLTDGVPEPGGGAEIARMSASSCRGSRLASGPSTPSGWGRTRSTSPS
jgi:Mg-chelatase subunit ChlD